MPRVPKYKDQTKAYKQGLRRVRKNELRELGYSERSVLYTRKDVKNPTRFFTRADLSRIENPIKEKRLFDQFGFPQVKRERIKAANRKLFRRTFVIYSDFKNPITLTQAIEKTRAFLDFLRSKFNPKPLNQIGIIYKGDVDDFSLQPRLWRDRESLVVERLQEMLKKYKAKIKINFIIGWIEQSN